MGLALMVIGGITQHKLLVGVSQGPSMASGAERVAVSLVAGGSRWANRGSLEL